MAEGSFAKQVCRWQVAGNPAGIATGAAQVEPRAFLA
jgi:hypothetical protein